MAISAQQNIISTLKQYGQRLFVFIRNRVGSHEEAEDILQDVWQQLSSMVNLDEIEHTSGWLHRVARNRIIDRQRKNELMLLSYCSR